MNSAKSAVCKVHIAAPIERVWEALVKPGSVLPHFYNSVLDTTALQPGAPLRMRSPDHKYTAVVGDILVVEPPRRFAHTFKFTQLGDPPCRVTYELTPVDGGTELVMLLDEMPPGTKTEKSMVGGARFITRTLKGVLETGRPPLGSRVFLRMIGLLAFLTPAKCRSEHWPLDRRIA